VVVQDKGSKDGWVQLCVQIFLEQNKVQNLLKGGKEKIDNFCFSVLTFQFSDFADGSFHSGSPGGHGGFDICS